MFKELIKWSHQEYAHLPWRKNRTLYGTLVSEIMLQQTTVATVTGHFERFLKVFPTIKDLGQASEEEVLYQWKGLGYYRRAKNLFKACQFICEKNNGQLSQSREELLTIPGIGEYTASALIAIGRNQQDLAVDANIERVINRLFDLKCAPGPKGQKTIREFFRSFPPKDFFQNFEPRAVNESLMDLGRVFCQSKKVSCSLCPMMKSCRAYQLGKISEYLSTGEKKADKQNLTLVRFIVRHRGKVLAQKREKGKWLEGQYEVPSFVIGPTEKNFHQYPKLSLLAQKKVDSPIQFKTAITKYSIKNIVVELSPNQFKKIMPKYSGNFTKIDTTHFSTASVKAFNRIGISD